MTTKTPKKSARLRFLDSLVGEPLTLSSLLLTIRETDDPSQAELAARLGVSKSHRCDIEKGRKAISPERASRFAPEIGHRKDQFFGFQYII
jgi:transcriptional regulator with XRE-family HTH domain